MAKRDIYVYISLSSIAMSLITAWPVFAQPPFERAIRETDRDVRGKVEEKLITPPKKPAKPVEEMPKAVPVGPNFFLKKIDLMGVESFKEEDFLPVIQKYENREVNLSELKDVLAKLIEREYLKKGVIAACFVPPQEVKDGVVIMRVVEAKMGQLEIKKARYFWSDRVDFYWTTRPGEVLNYGKISRSLQFMNKNPDREVKATLHAGKKPGTTDVLLDVKTQFPLHFTATFDREGAVSTGIPRTGLGIVENNLMGFDDTFMGGYTGGKNFGGGYAYQRIPITNFGTTLLYGYSLTRAFPKKDYQQFEMSSKAESMSAFLYQDLYTADEYKGEVSVGFEAKNKRVVWTQGDMNADRLRVIRTALSLVGRGPMNVTTAKAEYSQGINGLGATRRNPLSSRNAINTFSKGVISASFKQGLAKNFQASFKFNSMIPSVLLMPQEELYMGGIDTIRGYPSGDYLADCGFYTNSELLIPAFFLPDWLKVPYGERPIKDEITGVLFVDWGYGILRGGIQGDENKRKMASAGFGARIRLLDQINCRFEWGWVLKEMANRPLTSGCPYRMHIAFDLQDRMPREMERLQGIWKEDYIKDEAWDILNEDMRQPSSVLRERIYDYIRTAKDAEARGDLKEAKKYYQKAANLGNSAYRQTEKYIKSTYKQVEDLKKLSAAGWEYYDKGEFLKAKEVWQKVKDNAKIAPLTIEVI